MNVISDFDLLADAMLWSGWPKVGLPAAGAAKAFAAYVAHVGMPERVLSPKQISALMRAHPGALVIRRSDSEAVTANAIIPVGGKRDCCRLRFAPNRRWLSDRYDYI